MKRGQKDISKSDLGEAEDKGHSDILNPEPTTTSKADEMNSGDVSHLILVSKYEVWTEGVEGNVLGSI